VLEFSYLMPTEVDGSRALGSSIPVKHSKVGLPNQRMKLSWRGGRLKGNGSVLLAAAAPRSLCAIR